MIRGYYTAASGVYTQEKKLNNIANNITNASTVGYKRDELVLGTFGEHIGLRMNAYQETRTRDIGESVYMQIVDEKYTNHSQGAFLSTSRPLDLSIMGAGYFVIADEDGEEFFTRDGQFSIDEDGYLTLPGFGRVQGQAGDIDLTVSDISVDALGNIFTENEDGELELVDQLMIAIPDDYTAVEKLPSSLYAIGEYTEADENDHPLIRQFQLERSNVNMSDEMSSMIASQRALQSCSQVVKMYDEMAGVIASQISRVQ